ncbi:MAG: methylenetetrahydrofolate reductase [NAD(P)H] [Candidatus Omnitrophica bacterium]|jgi:methylenetetrahydrofolate reductase (NADPH)|nr:methylenetetrahydrofolate reductase [NAD(P)H] [Candidatus Omnitrophota bacterium]
MKIIDILKTHDKGVSFEFFPPKTDNGMNSFMNTVRDLKAYKPLYVSMTYGAAGSTQGATKEATYLLIKEKDFTVMPHLTCIGANVDNIRNLLDGYKQNGIENIMALRGDIPQGKSDFDLKSQALCYAKDLVGFIKENGNFCTGVAVYPEGHIETKTLDEDIEYTKQKINAGANFAVTQMFFDNSHFYNFLERAAKKGINIPVLPGIFPLSDIDKLKKFCMVARTTIPRKVEEEMSRFRDNPQDMEKCGIDFTIKQCRDLISHGHSRLHFFTFNKSEMIRAILNAIF